MPENNFFIKNIIFRDGLKPFLLNEKTVLTIFISFPQLC